MEQPPPRFSPDNRPEISARRKGFVTPSVQEIRNLRLLPSLPPLPKNVVSLEDYKPDGTPPPAA